MRFLVQVALAFLLVLPAGSPALARIATIEATAPLDDQSEQAIQAAFLEALKAALQQAEAMGFTWLALGQADVLEDRVPIQLFATDTEPEGEHDEAGPSPRGEPV